MGFAPKAVMTVALSIIFVAALIPTAFSQFFSADTSGWDAGTVALWAIIPLAVLALIVLKYVGGSGGKGE